MRSTFLKALILILMPGLGVAESLAQLPGSRCVSTVEGRNWVGTETGGIHVLDIPSGKSTPLIIPELPLKINDILAGRDSVVYVATDKGLYFVRHQAIVQHYDRNKGIASDVVTSLAQADDGTLWLGTDRGLASLLQTTYRLYNRDAGLLGDGILDVDIDGNGRITVLTDNGISFITSSGIQQFRIKNAAAMAVGDDGIVYVGARDGLKILDKDVVPILQMTDQTFIDIHVDPIGKVWMVSAAGRVFEINRVGAQYVLGEVTMDFPLRGQAATMIRSNPVGEKTVFTATAFSVKPLVDADTPYRDHLVRLAREYTWLGRWNDAAAMLSSAFQTFKGLNDSITLLQTWAFVLHEMGKPAEAMQPIDRLMTLDPISHADSTARSVGALLGGDIQWAAKSESTARYYQFVVQEGGPRATVETAYWRLAAYYDSTGNLPEAVRWLTRFTERFGDSERFWEATARLAVYYSGIDTGLAQKTARFIGESCTDLDVLAQFDSVYRLVKYEALIRSYEEKCVSLPPPLAIPIQDTITCYVADADRLWFGTTNGLLKIQIAADGKLEQTRFTVDSGLVDQRIHGLAIDRHGRLWVACGGPNEKGRDIGGLMLWDAGKWIVYGAAQGIRGGRVNQVAVSDDRIIIGTPLGILVSKNVKSPYWVPLQKAGKRIPSKLLLDNIGRLWLMENRTVQVENDGGFAVVTVEPADSAFSDSTHVVDFGMDDVGNKLAFAHGGVYKFDGTRFRPLFRSESPDTVVMAWAVDVRGSVLLGSSAGFSKHNDLAVVRFDVSDSMPSQNVIGIHQRGSDCFVLTTAGVYRYKESPLDTLKMLRQVRETLDRLISERNFQRARQISRQLSRVPALADYFAYELVRSFEAEEKWFESLNYLTEYVNQHGKTSHFNEYAFFRVVTELERSNDHERADVLLRAMLRGFSSQLPKASIRLDDESLLDFRVQWLDERNPYLRSVVRHTLRRAGKQYEDGRINDALTSYKFIPALFSNIPLNDMQAQLMHHLKAAESSDRTVRIKLVKQILKITGGQDDRMRLLFEQAQFHHRAEQYREAASSYQDLVNDGRWEKLLSELRSLLNETKLRAELGLKAGSGYSEVNSTNAMDFEGNYLWLGTSKGVIRWNLSEGSYRKYTTTDGLITDYIYDLAIDSSGGKWFVGSSLGYNDDRGGISHFDGEKFQNFNTTNGLAGNKIRCVTIDRAGVVWVGGDYGVSAWKDGRWINHDLRKRFDFEYVSALTVDGAGKLWIGLTAKSQFPTTTGGAVLFDETSPVIFSIKNGLSSNTVKSIRADADQNIWFSTTGGVSIYTPATRQWKYLNSRQKLPSDVIRSVEFANHQIWFATDQGLGVLQTDAQTRGASAVADNTSVRSFAEKDGLLTNDIRVVRYHPEFGTWVGSRRGSFSVGNFAAVETEEASETYNRKLFEVSVESEAIFEKAQQFIEQGDFDKAREIYLDVLDRVGGGEWSDDAQFLLAKSYELEGNYDQAEKKYAEFVAANPESDLVANAYIGMGNAFEKQKKYDKAEEAFKQAETASADKSVAEQARILSEKVKVRKMAAERAATESMAQSLSQKYNELDKETGEGRAKLLAEIEALEKKVAASAKAGGFNLKLYKVQEGESLWSLSQKFLGDPTKWRDFFIANEGKVTDPNLIGAGQTIVVLTLEKGQKEHLDKFVYYDVAAGEDLETIASKLYGNKDQWRLIYEANKEKLSASPRKSLGRTRLVIPVEE